jgi:hypothetical protein
VPPPLSLSLSLPPSHYLSLSPSLSLSGDRMYSMEQIQQKKHKKNSLSLSGDRMYSMEQRPRKCNLDTVYVSGRRGGGGGGQ